MAIDKGMFVTFEGVDGSGKTTVMAVVYGLLKAAGLPVVATREPGGVAIAEQIRQIILDNGNTAMDPRTEALLYAASRRQHLVEVLRPLLAAGKLVLSDRFIDSSLAYQGYARGIGLKEVETINAFAMEGLWPDVTYYLDVRPRDALKRIAGDAGHEENRLDVEKLSFHERVYEGYAKLLKIFPQRMMSIDGYQPMAAESRQIAADIAKRWTARNSH